MGLKRFFKRGEGRTGGGAADADERPAAEGEDDLAERAANLSRSLGQMPADEQRVAAIERLTELRAAGRVSEENFLKEKRRLERRG